MTDTTKLLDEAWLPVKGRENVYEVSNIGRVRHIRTKRIKKQRYKSGEKYRLVTLFEPQETIGVHRLVAMAFIPNPEGKPQVNHIDNNPENNNIKNLEWCTAKENLHHAMKQGRMYVHPKGLPSPTRSFSNEEAIEIRRHRNATGDSYNKMAGIFNTNKKTIMNICRGITYKECLPDQALKEFEEDLK